MNDPGDNPWCDDGPTKRGAHREAGVDDRKIEKAETAAVAVKHDLVVKEDLDVASRFVPAEAAAMRTQTPINDKKKKKKKPPTVQTGLEFVPLEQLRDWKWRESNMHFVASVLCARLLQQ